jgi:hypothetical protein
LEAGDVSGSVPEKAARATTRMSSSGFGRHMTFDERRALRAEIDRRRRALLAEVDREEAERLLAMFDDEGPLA